MADVRALCWLYGADMETTNALAALAPGTQQEDWWARRSRSGSGCTRAWKAAAGRLRCFEPQVVRGLVQTEGYARAVMSADTRRSGEVNSVGASRPGTCEDSGPPVRRRCVPRGEGFALLDFDGDEDPSVACDEGPGAARYLDTSDGRSD